MQCKTTLNDGISEDTCHTLYSLWTYNEYAKHLISLYKKQGNKIVGYYLTKLYVSFLQFICLVHDVNPKNALIVSMPANPTHVQQIGFDHMKLICNHLGTLMDMVVYSCISRRESRAQKELDSEQRLMNMQENLYMSCRKKRLLNRAVKSQNISYIILLDDIITTGATINVAHDIIRNAIVCETRRDITILGVSLLRKEF